MTKDVPGSDRSDSLLEISSSIEDRLDKSVKLREGIFFTAPHIVREISRRFDYSQVESVVDTAAGSCNFLTALADKHPKKQFYGVEKNREIYEAVLPTLADHANLHYFHGDILFDSFPIPRCDLYLGNPPFVNYTDLPDEYREKIRPLWKQYMPVSKGFSLLLGESRGDLASLIFYHSVAGYLKEGGQFGIILPNSLIKGNTATAGFREFRGISVERMVDISGKNAFVHTRRACFYMMGRRGGATTYPLLYEEGDKLIGLIKKNASLVPEDTREQEGSDYPVRQGINTLGANKIFFFDDKPDFEDELIHPLLRSGDVGEYRAHPSRWALLPYDREGKLVPPDTLERDYPRSWAYLMDHKEMLGNRKSRFVGKNWYALFGIGAYTFAPWKVVWRAMGAKKLEAAVITDAIPNQAMHGYIACESREEADYLCARLNSPELRALTEILSESRSRSFAQPGTIKQLPLKKYKRSAGVTGESPE